MNGLPENIFFGGMNPKTLDPPSLFSYKYTLRIALLGLVSYSVFKKNICSQKKTVAGFGPDSEDDYDLEFDEDLGKL